MSNVGLLEMPAQCMVLDSDEMMYLEGGAGWVLEETLTPQQCQRIANKMAFGATVAGVISGIAAVCGNAVAASYSFAVASGMALAAAHFVLAADGRGMKLYSRKVVSGGHVNPIYTTEYKNVFA